MLHYMSAQTLLVGISIPIDDNKIFCFTIEGWQYDKVIQIGYYEKIKKYEKDVLYPLSLY